VRTGADDNEVGGLSRQIEGGIECHVVDAGQAGDHRRGGNGTGRDDEAAGADGDLAGHEGAPVDEARRRRDHAHAEGGKPFGRGIHGKRFGDRDDVVADPREIHLERRTGDPDCRAAAEKLVVRGGGEQRLGGNRAASQIGAAHGALLDEDHRNGTVGSGNRHGDARRAAADDANVWFQLFRHAFAKTSRRRNASSGRIGRR